MSFLVQARTTYHRDLIAQEFTSRTFDFIITNPPIRASKPVIYRMFADAASRLNPGGALYLVIRKQQGAESCMKYLKTLYAKVDKVDKSGGFWVLRATEPLCAISSAFGISAVARSSCPCESKTARDGTLRSPSV